MFTDTQLIHVSDREKLRLVFDRVKNLLTKNDLAKLAN